MFVEQLVKQGIPLTVAEYQSYQDPPEDTVVIRSPFSNGWGVDAPKQIFISYDLELVRRRTEQVKSGKSVNQMYAYRMVSQARKEFVRRFVQNRLTKKEREALGEPEPQNDMVHHLAGNFR